ncbi:4Fe-4S dicluster domain-containing protein [Slackia heliotrinireducens]|uniref:Fe-S-cluster-containing hydrogenase subunit n=1 Tax=Slackia heliotrinireducens (strain ATCC 29202 / DSM 20476 / NCTC 11029 / RHS 1) TaxID=471855 RepID=C7N167_SLAHD|nr:4Fe-4S dicluster domain-containing protein [Slackia heliotrinireducens]ACV23289.1 Fe-S-cluster-containing hydrogenase subunit [Slackia heliotrinireducens DSM 20476]VEH02466.1 quinol dehydrogenase periplasmic component [Slackia heliotrinireducens]
MSDEPNKNTQQEEKERTYAGMSRRTLLIGAGGAAVALGLGTLKPLAANAVVRPPGGQDEDLMLGACIRCEKCIEACPRRVIAPTHVEDGFINLRTPTMDYALDYCDWCTEENDGVPLCVAACPTQALKLPADATPENTILGIAEINKDWCLAYRFKGCRFCYDACPYEAMEMDENNIPHVIEDKCNGCGLCYTVCVSMQDASVVAGMTDRAIVVKPIER